MSVIAVSETPDDPFGRSNRERSSGSNDASSDFVCRFWGILIRQANILHVFVSRCNFMKILVWRYLFRRHHRHKLKDESYFTNKRVTEILEKKLRCQRREHDIFLSARSKAHKLVCSDVRNIADKRTLTFHSVPSSSFLPVRVQYSKRDARSREASCIVHTM